MHLLRIGCMHVHVHVSGQAAHGSMRNINSCKLRSWQLLYFLTSSRD